MIITLEDLPFACPKCHKNDRIDFIPKVHVQCESCGWVFDFKKCKSYSFK